MQFFVATRMRLGGCVQVPWSDATAQRAASWIRRDGDREHLALDAEPLASLQ
jgi:hypothetical protein